MNIDVNYFPGWTRKSITFTIDDGSIPNDEIFLRIVKPRGIRGTFNLHCASYPGYTTEDFRRLYDGYEIANHCKNHPSAVPDGFEPIFIDAVYDHETAEDGCKYFYRDPSVEGLFWTKDSRNRHGKRKFAKDEDYIRFIEESDAELEAVFGEGSVGAFVWPYGEQKNTKVKEYLKSRDYYAIRKTGSLMDSTGFSLPADRSEWSYNCGHLELLRAAELYEKYPDDGELKMFSFGVHSVDYVVNNRLGDLEEFAKKYGNRPEDFYYATNREIFEYADAVKCIEISDEKISNPTSIRLYIKIDGERVVLDAHSEYEFCRDKFKN